MSASLKGHRPPPELLEALLKLPHYNERSVEEKLTQLLQEVRELKELLKPPETSIVISGPEIKAFIKKLMEEK